MLLLKELQLKNFLSHSDTKVEFNPKQKMLVDGKSGAGKSAIVEALVWVLYGKGRSDNKSLIKHSEKTGEVSITLENEGEVFQVVRTATETTNKLKLFKQTKKGNFLPIKVSGMKSTQDYLEKEILNSSYLLFINSIVYLQESSETFVKQTAAKRKDILLEIAKTNDYDEYYKKSKEKLDEINVLVEKDLAVIDSLEVNIASDVTLAKTVEEKRERNSDTKKVLEVLKEEDTKITDRISEISKQQEKVSVLKTDIRMAENALSRENELIRMRNESIIELLKIDVQGMKEKATGLLKFRTQKEEISKQEEKLEKWKSDRLSLMNFQPINFAVQSHIDDINTQIIYHMGKTKNLCSNVECPYFSKEGGLSEIKRLEERLKAKLEEKSVFLKEEAEYLKKVNELGTEPIVDIASKNLVDRELEKLRLLELEISKYSNVPQDIKNHEQGLAKSAETVKIIEAEIQELKNKLAAINIDQKDLDAISAGRIALRKSLDLAESNYMIAASVLNSALEAEGRVKQSKEKIKELKEKNVKLTDDMEGLKMLKQAFGNNGIKAMVIDFIIPRLEEKINDILGKLSDFRIKLETQRTGTKDTVIEGLFITILNELGLEFSFDNYSGGERLKIIVAISEALAEIQKIGFRVMDEVFIGLDEESTEKFVEVMATLQNRFDQMLCISHLRNIKDTFDERMEVIKTNGNSEVV